MNLINFKTGILSICILIAGGLTFSGCNGGANKSDAEIVSRVDSFLVAYNKEYKKLTIEANEGQWQLLTHMVKGDTVTSNLAQKASERIGAFLGSAENIKLTQEFLEK